MAQITYADKTALNVNSSIADINKVNASDMNEIKSVVNTNDSNVGDLSSLATDIKTSIVGAINEIKNAEIYSTSETKTNKVWIDGNPIYRKVFEWTNTAIQNGTELSAPISNINLVVGLTAYLRNIGDLEMFPLINASGKPLQCQYVKSTQKLKFIGTDCLSAGANRTIFAIVEYTKTS